MSQKFFLSFEGSTDELNPKDFTCKLVINGDVKAIGTLMAQYAKAEALNGHKEFAWVIQAIMDKIQEDIELANRTGFKSPGMIIKPNKFKN